VQPEQKVLINGASGAVAHVGGHPPPRWAPHDPERTIERYWE
jgi:hypothetical protein